MKILHTCKIFYPEISGVTSYVHEVAKRQASMGHDVAVLTWGRPDESGDMDGFCVRRVQSGASEIYYNEIAAFMPDVVHAHSIWEHVGLSAHYAEQYGKKFVLTMHGTFNFLKSSYNLLRISELKEFFKWCCYYRHVVWPGIARSAFAVICLNRQERLLAKSLGVSGNSIVSIPNAVDCKLFSPVALPKIHAQASDTFRVLFVGRVQSQKGIFTLLKSIKVLSSSSVPIRLDVIGLGPHLDRSKNYVESSGLSSCVFFHGRVSRPDIPQWYRRSDIVVLPSENEPFSTVYLEAMACALPCIGLDEGGTPEIIDHGKTGFLIKRNDWKTLAVRISFLYKQNSARLCMGLNGRVKVCKNFNWDIVAQKITETYS